MASRKNNDARSRGEWQGISMMITVTLFRAADDDIVTDCASFSESRESAAAYLNNPGFGGSRLYRAEARVDSGALLDLAESDDPVAEIVKRLGIRHPGAIGADEWIPRISYELRDIGIEWVRVRESYPADTITWIFVGVDEPEMEEI